MRHPDDDSLVAFLEGRLDPTGRAGIESHLAVCDDCRRVVAEMGRQAPRDDDTRPTSPTSDRELAPGDRLGRFQVLGRLGAGGMGIVYAAYDPELDRKVALKLYASTDADDPVRGRALLLREAQAMARLSHRNALTVFDFGTYYDRVYVAMELVDGMTLAAWLQLKARRWKEVLSVFLGVGEGLAAAHAAGIVHRDVKPSNVMIGRDGSVRVMDFGLARRTAREMSGERRALTGGIGTTPETLAQPGALVGTPHYMSPEQLAGRPADARSDQFSFCVALYEALYGERPFQGRSIEELLSEISEFEVRPAPLPTRSIAWVLGRPRHVPVWLRRIVVRGLHPDPARRYPSMATLVGALREDPWESRRRAIAVGGLAAGIAVALLVAAGVRSTLVCKDVTRPLADAWNEARKATAHRAFSATGASFAEDSWRRVAESLDRYAERWSAGRKELCLATAQGTRPDRTVAPIARCFDRRLGELAAMVELLETADASIVEHAVRASQELPPIESCALARSRPQDDADPERRARIDAIWTRSQKALARLNAGRPIEGRAEMAAVLADAKDVGDPELEATARIALALDRYEAGELSDAERQFEEAASAAERAEDDLRRARAWVGLTAIAAETGRLDEARRRLRTLDSIVARVEDEPGDLTAERLGAEGNLANREGRHRDAVRIEEQALALRERRHGPTALPVAHSLNNLAVSLDAAGKREEAERAYRRAAEIYEQRLGAMDASLATVLDNLGTLLGYQGKFDAADASYRRALAIRETIFGKESGAVADNLVNLGTLETARGHHAESAAILERARAIQERRLPPGDPYFFILRHNIGELRMHEKRPAEAEVEFRAAAAGFERALGSDHLYSAISRGWLALALLDRGRAREALTQAERARVTMEKTTGGESFELARPLAVIGLAQRDGGLAAKTSLEDALRLLEAEPGRDPVLLARVREALGR